MLALVASQAEANSLKIIHQMSYISLSLVEHVKKAGLL
jgi:hypothetical protein